MNEAESAPALRLDIWLWRARFYKTRAMATQSVRRRAVRISRGEQTRRTNKPGAMILPGDIVTFRKAGDILDIEVLGLGERRGPASEAQLLYRVLGEE